MHVVILTILAAAIAFAGFAPAYARTGVRPSVSLPSPDVRLTDIFPGAENNAVIARTPAPGRRLVLDVYALTRLARRHDINWKPRTQYDQSVVTRKSRVLEVSEIERALKTTLVSRGMAADRHVELTNRSAAFRVATGVAESFRIENPVFDDRSGRVSAVLAVRSGAAEDPKYRLDATTFSIVEIPTLNRRIRRGETVESSDVVWKSVRKDTVGRNFIRDRDAVVGKAARRYMAAGKPLLIDDLEAPKLIRKGALVTIYLQTANLRLTAKARATEDGALNDTISVVNVRSKKVVEAVVRSPTKVVIPTELPATN